MIGWCHQLNGREFEQIWGDGEPWYPAVMGLQRVRHDLATNNNNRHCQDRDFVYFIHCC